jgi:hypothetical protein
MAATASYRIGETRFLKLRKEYMLLEDTESKKFLIISFQKWKRLMDLIEEIDDSINRVSNREENFSFRQHIGGGCFVSVTSGIRRVDIRKFYKPDSHTQSIAPYVDIEEVLKPTRIGLALKFEEWNEVKGRVNESVNRLRPDVRDLQLCFMNGDHRNQQGKYAFRSCVCVCVCVCVLD